MASGKSTIGAILADQLGVPFVDTDSLIEAAFGMSVAKIFIEKGEAAFRDEERATILNVLKGEQQVIAVGGGAFVDPATRASLAATAHTIWLDPPFETILVRLEQSSARPIATTRTNEELRELWSERRQFYSMADMHIEISNADPAHAAREIVNRLTHS